MTRLYRGDPDLVTIKKTTGFALVDHVIYRPVRNVNGHLMHGRNRPPGSELALSMEGKVRVLALVGEAGHKAERDTNIEFIGINEPGERGDLARRMIAAGYPMVGGKGVQVIRLHCSIPCDQLLKGDYQQAGHGAICHLAEEDRQALRPHFERLHEKYDYWD